MKNFNHGGIRRVRGGTELSKEEEESTTNQHERKSTPTASVPCRLTTLEKSGSCY